MDFNELWGINEDTYNRFICRVKPLEDAAFEKFKGSCIVRIIHAFSGKTKGISTCTDEIINYDSKKSYYNEFPED